jgi:hypothetical protein
MKSDGLPVLCGLFLAGWAYHADNARVLGWAAALTAAILLARPLTDLVRLAIARFLRPPVSVPVPVAPPPSPMDAKINAAIDAFAAAKEARVARHIRR